MRAMSPATASPSSGGAEDRRVHLRRVAGALAGVLDDEPADAAADARGDLGHDRADDGRAAAASFSAGTR